MFRRPASAADSKWQQRSASDKGGSTACACIARVFPCEAYRWTDARCGRNPAPSGKRRLIPGVLGGAGGPEAGLDSARSGITLELMRNPISTADGQAGGALTWYSSRGTQGLVRARCRPVSPMQCKPASSFVQRDRAAPVPVLPRWLHRWLDTGAIPCWRCGATPLQPRPGPDGGPAAGLRAGGDRGAAARTRLLAPHWCCPFATKTLVRLGLRAEAHGPRREVNEGRGTKKATGVVGPAVEDCVYGRRTT